MSTLIWIFIGACTVWAFCMWAAKASQRQGDKAAWLLAAILAGVLGLIIAIANLKR